MDQLLAIRVFTRVVDAGSFIKAAESLAMPKATVSKLVASLEDHLRVKLLQRTTRRVTVTADGAAYYERAGRVLAELDEIDAALGNAQQTPRGTLRVSAGGSVTSVVLLPALPSFRERYPDVQVDLHVTDRPVDVVAENVDCVIRTTSNDPSLIARRLGLLQWTLCAAPGYLQRRGRPRHPNDLADKHDIVGYVPRRGGRALPFELTNGRETVTVAPEHAVTVNESTAHLTAALAGLGIVHTFAFMAKPHIATGHLVPLLEAWRATPQPIYVAYAANRHLSTRVRAFVDWAVSVFAEHT